MAACVRNRNSWGPMSIPNNFHKLNLNNDEEYAEEYTERMITAQMKQLDPLKEDLADWLNKTLRIDYINRENFFQTLENGDILCRLAKHICECAKKYPKQEPQPIFRGKWFEKAIRRSFFSRDNMENFIKFCRSIGVHENLLFESDDLVLHNQPRNVILCLLEVARIATKYGIEPPGLVQLEKEIAEEENRNSLLSWQFQVSPSPESKMRISKSANAISSYANRWNTGPHVLLLPDKGAGGDTLVSLPTGTSGASDGVPSDNTEDEWSRGSGEDPDLDILDSARQTPSVGGGGDTPTSTSAPSELDRKVQLAARLMQRNCVCASGKCEKLKVRKVGEGKYNIAGKNVFVRLLKGRHMMVRVGGGWDTLDHFLLRHDPCQVKVISRTSPDRPSSASKFLHIRAKYRSPPPREQITR